MFFHAFGNFNSHSPLRRSFAYSLNVASRPWQFLPLRQSITHSLNVLSCSQWFQFTFPAPAIIRTFPECRLMPLAVSPAPAVDHTFPECSFMPSAISIYISAPTVIRIFPECCLTPLAVSPAPAVDHTFPECPFMPLAISIYISHSDDHSHIPWMSLHVLGNFNLYSSLRWSIIHSLNILSCPRLFQFRFPALTSILTFLEYCLMLSKVSICILYFLNIISCSW